MKQKHFHPATGFTVTELLVAVAAGAVVLAAVTVASVALQKSFSAADKFLGPQIHGDAVFLFNKKGSVRALPVDHEAFVRGLLERRRRLTERMELFGPFVPKEIHRGNWLEALEFYRGVVLQSLVEALRMQYGPVHYDFRMRYVYRELPPNVLRRLERLAFVKDPDELAAKYPQALVWFREAIEAVDERQVRRQIFDS